MISFPGYLTIIPQLISAYTPLDSSFEPQLSKDGHILVDGAVAERRPVTQTDAEVSPRVAEETPPPTSPPAGSPVDVTTQAALDSQRSEQAVQQPPDQSGMSQRAVTEMPTIIKTQNPVMSSAAREPRCPASWGK